MPSPATPGPADERARPPTTVPVCSFEVTMTRLVGPDGVPVADLPPWADRPEELIRLYRAMVLTRAYDAKAVALQRTGRLGTFASSLGQEGVAVGVGAAMRDDDVLVPSFREQGAQFLRGVEPAELLRYWGGDERGSDFAGVRRLPVVFVVNNNQWAISVPVSRQTAAETLAQKAIAAGFPGVRVDGNDVIAVREVVGEAIERARRGEGPTLVEAVTYRLADHTTADDASRYRSDAEVSEHWKREPVARLRELLVQRGAWGREQEEALLAECAAAIDAAVEAYLGTAPRPPESMFDHLYATLPDALASQRAEVAQLGGGGDG